MSLLKKVHFKNADQFYIAIKGLQIQNIGWVQNEDRRPKTQK